MKKNIWGLCSKLSRNRSVLYYFGFSFSLYGSVGLVSSESAGEQEVEDLNI